MILFIGLNVLIIMLRGDNSADSRDSRYFGYIPETLIVGKFNLRTVFC